MYGGRPPTTAPPPAAPAERVDGVLPKPPPGPSCCSSNGPTFDPFRDRGDDAAEGEGGGGPIPSVPMLISLRYLAVASSYSFWLAPIGTVSRRFI